MGEISSAIQNQWMFVSAFVNYDTNSHFGIRYYLDSVNRKENVVYKSRSVGTCHWLLSSTRVYWGGDGFYNHCFCDLQYLRLYWNYLADSQEKMMNLAMMDTNGIIYPIWRTFLILSL